jgi:hypothetical protein
LGLNITSYLVLSKWIHSNGAPLRSGGTGWGDDGDDAIYAGAGDDFIFSGYGNDVLSGGAGVAGGAAAVQFATISLLGMSGTLSAADFVIN